MTLLAAEHVGVADGERRGAADRFDRAQLFGVVDPFPPIDERDGAERLAGDDERNDEHTPLAAPLHPDALRPGKQRITEVPHGDRLAGGEREPGRRPLVGPELAGHPRPVDLAVVEAGAAAQGVVFDDVDAADRRPGDVGQAAADRQQHVVYGQTRREQRAGVAHQRQAARGLALFGVDLRVDYRLGGDGREPAQQLGVVELPRLRVDELEQPDDLAAVDQRQIETRAIAEPRGVGALGVRQACVGRRVVHDDRQHGPHRLAGDRIAGERETELGALFGDGLAVGRDQSGHALALEPVERAAARAGQLAHAAHDGAQHVLGLQRTAELAAGVDERAQVLVCLVEAIEQHVELTSRIARRGDRLDVLGHVAQHQHAAELAAAAVAQRRLADVQVMRAPVEAHRDRAAALGAERVGLRRDGLVQLAGIEPGKPVALVQALGRPNVRPSGGQQPLRGAVGADDAALAVGHEHRVAHVLEDARLPGGEQIDGAQPGQRPDQRQHAGGERHESQVQTADRRVTGHEGDIEGEGDADTRDHHERLPAAEMKGAQRFGEQQDHAGHDEPGKPGELDREQGAAPAHTDVREAQRGEAA